ncbi:hypothetical protein Goari_006731 [Gossypium aridum]|uniref:Uncharacterized protein n=1 Tax=Gossypium aridum TaxID=34290 RepID=A0A7J8XQI5_GOSAI|nr:hypothetical protein [Gossypium aridum]
MRRKKFYNSNLSHKQEERLGFFN